jgi:hypothetical protein
MACPAPYNNCLAPSPRRRARGNRWTHPVTAKTVADSCARGIRKGAPFRFPSHRRLEGQKPLRPNHPDA